MKTFQVKFHAQDQVDQMEVQKLGEADFERATESGTRQLFELDTNIGFFVFFDGVDATGTKSYLVLHYEGDHEEPTACYGFELKDFYEFAALYLNDLEFDAEAAEGEEIYSPIQHLAHLLYHITEEGKKIEL